MIDFDLLAIASTLVMVLSVLGITISATLLINDPPSSQVLKVWRLNIKHAGRDTLMEIMYKVMKVFESQKEGMKQKVYDDKMLRLKMDETYADMKSRLDKQLAMGLSVSGVLLLLGMMTLQIVIILFATVTSLVFIAMYYMPFLEIDRKIKEKNKKMVPELLSILDSFKIFHQAGLLDNIVKDNLDILVASRNDLLLLQATLVSEGELVAFTEFGERINTDLFKEFTSLVKSAIQGADSATMVVNIRALEDSIYAQIDRNLKETVEFRWRMVTSMIFVIFIPIVLIFGGPVLIQMSSLQ